MTVYKFNLIRGSYTTRQIINEDYIVEVIDMKTYKKLGKYPLRIAKVKFL